MDRKRIIVGFSTAALLIVCYAKLFAGQKPKRKRIQNKEMVNRSVWVRKKPTISKEEDLWNTAIFFPDYFPEREYSKTRELIWYLEQAEFTIDVCTYSFAFRMIEEALIKLARENRVKIRILTNKRIPRDRLMRRAKIQTRTKNHIWTNYHDRTQYVDLMHHKFVVIDSWAAMTGSLNWTMASITENFENMLITTEPRIVTKYVGEFERLWEESNPRPRPPKNQAC